MRQFQKEAFPLLPSLSPCQLEILSSAPLFAGVEEQELLSLLDCADCCLEQFPAGASIYRPDRFRRCLGVLLSGQVRVTKAELAVNVLEPGALFGAAALYNDAPDYATTLTALSPCTAVMIQQELLDRMLGEHAVLRQNYLRYLSGRIRFLSARLQALAAGGAEGRLIRYLLENTSDGVLLCPATELAQRLGISRASLYRAFSTLETAGLIRRQGKQISVPDPAALGCAL